MGEKIVLGLSILGVLGVVIGIIVAIVYAAGALFGDLDAGVGFESQYDKAKNACLRYVRYPSTANENACAHNSSGLSGKDRERIIRAMVREQKN